MEKIKENTNEDLVSLFGINNEMEEMEKMIEDFNNNKPKEFKSNSKIWNKIVNYYKLIYIYIVILSHQMQYQKFDSFSKL